jgi:hypothetical protein
VDIVELVVQLAEPRCTSPQTSKEFGFELSIRSDSLESFVSFFLLFCVSVFLLVLVFICFSGLFPALAWCCFSLCTSFPLWFLLLLLLLVFGFPSSLAPRTLEP